MKQVLLNLKRRNFVLWGFLMIWANFVNAQEPTGYYDNASGLAGAELKTALHHIVKGGTRLDYGSGAGKTWSGFEKTDLHPEGYVWDMYSYNKVKFPGNGGAPSGMNIEHSVAKSWWGGTKNNAYKDLYHLNPSNSNANSARSNYPLGIVKDGKVTGSLKIGNNSFGQEYSDICFEPLDEYKGDFARAYMYMFTCYEDLTWTGTNAPTMVKNERYPMLRPWAAQMLVEWSRQDPVSEKELKRAAEIYKIQHNRNPFIDYPELAEYLWGEKKGEPFFFTVSSDPMFITPAQNAVYQFQETHYEGTSFEYIKISGRNLTSDIQLSLSGADADLFELSTTVVSAEQAAEGFELKVTFHPVKAVPASARLVLETDGVVSRIVSLNAVATEEFTALPAVNVTQDSFDATWTSSSLTNRFSLRVYTKQTIEQEDVLQEDASFKGQKPAGWTTAGYSSLTDDNKSGIRLASGSSNGVLTSPKMDFSIGGRIYINAKQWAGDGEVSLQVTLGTKKLDAIKLNETYHTYEIIVPENEEESEVVFTAEKGKRLYIASVQIYSGGEVITEFNQSGYPLIIENSKIHTVTGLEADQLYYYRVTPILDASSESDEIEVRTKNATSLDNSLSDAIKVFVNGKDLRLENIPLGSEVSVFDIAGKKVFTQYNMSTSLFLLELKAQGIYIIKVYSKRKVETIKIITN